MKANSTSEIKIQNHDLLLKISEEVGNSFYLLHEENYLTNLSQLKNAFKLFFNKLIIGYSFKTNYIPDLCKIAKDQGIYAEVVSDMELDLALKLGYDYNKIIFNGPLKNEGDIEQVLLNNGIVNLDSFHEIKLLTNIVKRHPNHQFKVGLRINMSLINADGSSSIQKGLKVGRFGFEESKKELGKAIKLLNQLKVTINGLHGHTSSSDRSLRNFKTIATTLCRVRDDYELNHIEYFNLGGGFYGPMPKELAKPKVPNFQEYAQAIFTVLEKNQWYKTNKPYIVLEPGVSVVSNALSYVSKVVDVKKIRTKNFLLIEGGVYNIKPTFHSLNLPFYSITKNKNDQTKRYDVVGSTCMEKDIVLSDVKIKGIEQGDFISINNVGAYTLVKTPQFINYLPAIVSLKNNKIRIARQKQTLQHLLQTYNF